MIHWTEPTYGKCVRRRDGLHISTPGASANTSLISAERNIPTPNTYIMATRPQCVLPVAEDPPLYASPSTSSGPPLQIRREVDIINYLEHVFGRYLCHIPPTNENEGPLTEREVAYAIWTYAQTLTTILGGKLARVSHSLPPLPII